MQYFGARSRAYDTDVIQLFKALADFTQPIELQKTLVASKNNNYDDNSSLLIFVVLSLSHAKESVWPVANLINILRS